MRKLVVGLAAVALGASTSVAFAGGEDSLPLLEAADGTRVRLDCPTEVVRAEEFLWRGIEGGRPPDNTPGPIGSAGVRERRSDFKEVGPLTLVIERSPGKAKFVVELLDDGRVSRATWCAGEDGVDEMFPDLGGVDPK